MGEIHFFTGKGGVGKTTVALSQALKLAEKGQKTLLVEYSQLNTFSQTFKMPVGFTPIKLEDNLHVASWNGEDCLQEYVKHSVKIKILFEMFYHSKAMSALIKAAPALKEISFLGYLTSHFRNVKPCLDFDSIIVDAPSTGHFISCLQVPKSLLAITSFGPMGHHCKGILDVLKDPQKTKVYTVFLPEELVINEQRQLVKTLKSEFEIQAQVWLNRSFTKANIEIPENIKGDKTNQRYISFLREGLKNEKQILSEKEFNINQILPESFGSSILQNAKNISLIPEVEV